MTDEWKGFRPERLFIASDVAAKLDADGLAIAKVRHHEDGSAELVLEPRIEDEDEDASSPGVMSDFVSGCLRSGLRENVCAECGQPWLTRGDSTLCPVCDPSHVGYHPGGMPPHRKAHYMTFWRSSFTGVLRARAADHQHRERLLRHQEAIGFQVYPPSAVATGIIRRLERSFEPRLDENDPEWRAGWERS